MFAAALGVGLFSGQSTFKNQPADPAAT